MASRRVNAFLIGSRTPWETERFLRGRNDNLSLSLSLALLSGEKFKTVASENRTGWMESPLFPTVTDEADGRGACKRGGGGNCNCEFYTLLRKRKGLVSIRSFVRFAQRFSIFLSFFFKVRSSAIFEQRSLYLLFRVEIYVSFLLVQRAIAIQFY